MTTHTKNLNINNSITLIDNMVSELAQTLDTIIEEADSVCKTSAQLRQLQTVMEGAYPLIKNCVALSSLLRRDPNGIRTERTPAGIGPDGVPYFN